MKNSINFSEPRLDFSHYYRLNDLDVIAFRDFVKKKLHDRFNSVLKSSLSDDELNILYHIYNHLRYGFQKPNKRASFTDNATKVR